MMAALRVDDLTVARTRYEEAQAAEEAAWARYCAHRQTCPDCRLYRPCDHLDALMDAWGRANESISAALKNWLAEASDTLP